MKENDIYNTEIVDNGMNFEGISKIDGITTFVNNAIISEKIKVKIKKVKKTYALGDILEIIERSSYRQNPICDVYDKCGGCSCQHIDYDFTLKLKKNIVENVLKKMQINYKKIDNCIGMGFPYYYRNKVQYPVRVDKNGNIKMGFYEKNSHEVVENKCCFIQDRTIDIMAENVFNKLIELGFNGYNEKNNTGDIRHIVIRRGYNTSEIMVILVINNEKLLNDIRFNKIVDFLKKIKDVKSIVLNVNNSNTNEILGKLSKTIYGTEYITEIIGEYKYLISSKSFFQVNTIQAEMLYNTLLEGLNLTKSEVVFDLYSGVGSIGIFLSNYVSKVYGIEIEPEAVKMANENIKINNIKNCEYIAGSVENKIEEFKNKNIKPDVIVVDPPRKGLDDKSIKYILEFEPEKIGYVSCNPATLARDLKKLEEKYDIYKITPVDMFPQTSHVETVVCLKCKKN